MDERYPNTTGRTLSPAAPHGERSMTDQAREVAQSARQGIEQAGEYLNETVSKTQEMVTRYTDGGVDRVKEDVVEYTRKQPMTALLIATGAGLLLGMLMSVGTRR
jgi:ElaB/YqjD/DUF883 family membrane-anchored ribosome-binding protein